MKKQTQKNEKQSLSLHKKYRGKISVTPKMVVRNMKDLSMVYTPGVAAVSKAIAAKPSLARDYTIRGTTIAIVSDGSAVLGLGNIGPEAALPVMEGKAMLFKTFGGIDAFPIVLSVHTEDEIVAAVKAIASGFAGINLEDIAAPTCFAVEERLKKELSIPVFHDDQHGTAVVVLAGLMNAAKVVGKKLATLRVVIVGAGAAGVATVNILLKAGVSNIVVIDRGGIIHEARNDLLPYKRLLAAHTNPERRAGTLTEAIQNADAVIGLSGPGIITAQHVRTMAQNSIVFALANPTPEIVPEVAKKAGARVVATGRSDFPNQINNSLAFPGIFKGALARRVPHITDDMKIAAAKALAALVKRPTNEHVLPTMFEKGVADAVARAIR